MSKKTSQSKGPTLSPLASAMYNAQRKEVTSSLVMSLSFMLVGIIVSIFSVVKYFNITGNMTDNSEKIDALAWLVIAAVGVGVVAIGVISLLKSFVSLGQLGSILKKTESHASPFQDQQVTRRVAAMNQSQAMKKAETASAEQRKQEKKKGGLFGKKKMSSSELYDKYNPPKNKNTVTQPPKAAPMMEQKFDYGINEEKELTFADEFLMKNKRDPFAQYRKDLGIKEAAPKPVEQKPQFIPSTPKKPLSTTVDGGHGSSFEFDLSRIKPISANTELSSAAEQTKQEPEPIQHDGKSLLSQLDFDGGFDSSEQPAAAESDTPTKPQPRSLLSQLDFDGGFDSSEQPASAETDAPTKPQPRSLLSQLDFDGSFDSDEQSVAAEPDAPTKPQPRSLLSQLDFDGFIEFDNDSEETKPEPVNTQPAAPAAATAKTDKVPIDNPVARRASIKAVSFLSDKFSDNAASVSTPVSPYGMHREEDDGIFFSTRSNNANVTQQQRPQAQQTVSPVVAVIAQRNDDSNLSTLETDTASSSDKYNLDNFAPKAKPERVKKDVSSEICKNGTPAQRKYVEASEFDEWTCPECGKVNQEYVGICACGRRKPRPRKK